MLRRGAADPRLAVFDALGRLWVVMTRRGGPMEDQAALFRDLMVLHDDLGDRTDMAGLDSSTRHGRPKKS